MEGLDQENPKEIKKNNKIQQENQIERKKKSNKIEQEVKQKERKIK